MIDSTDILGTSAQVAVTLAGFAGVVVVFGSAAVHEWSPVDKFRLRLMLLSSAFALVLCMVGLVLLAAGLPAAQTWRLGSALVVVMLLPTLVSGVATFRRFPSDELRRTGADRSVFYATSAAGFALVILQASNAASIAEFWPFLLAVVVSILISLLQFVRLILSRREV